MGPLLLEIMGRDADFGTLKNVVQFSRVRKIKIHELILPPGVQEQCGINTDHKASKIVTWIFEFIQEIVLFC